MNQNFRKTLNLDYLRDAWQVSLIIHPTGPETAILVGGQCASRVFLGDERSYNSWSLEQVLCPCNIQCVGSDQDYGSNREKFFAELKRVCEENAIQRLAMVNPRYLEGELNGIKLLQATKINPDLLKPYALYTIKPFEK